MNIIVCLRVCDTAAVPLPCIEGPPQSKNELAFISCAVPLPKPITVYIYDP